MGRAFEYRKARKLKRWGHMARVITKIGKEIEIAVKAGGPDPSGNTRLRILMQNAKAENMPKGNVERAIKRATEKDAADYKEVIYEGYGSHGIAFLVETATDNTNRTVATSACISTSAAVRWAIAAAWLSCSTINASSSSMRPKALTWRSWSSK